MSYLAQGATTGAAAAFGHKDWVAQVDTWYNAAVNGNGVYPGVYSKHYSGNHTVAQISWATAFGYNQTISAEKSAAQDYANSTPDATMVSSAIKRFNKSMIAVFGIGGIYGLMGGSTIMPAAKADDFWDEILRLAIALNAGWGVPTSSNLMSESVKEAINQLPNPINPFAWASAIKWGLFGLGGYIFYTEWQKKQRNNPRRKNPRRQRRR